MPASGGPPNRRRRFLRLRIVLYVLSLPLVLWVMTRYGSSAWSYVQSYPRLMGIWFWLWTLIFAWATWGVWRLVRRKWARARALAAEVDAPRR